MWILVVSLRVLISGHAMTAIFMFYKALHSIFLPEGSILVISKATPTPDKEATILAFNNRFFISNRENK